ncbi:MAG: hypothetical protein ACREHG_04520, partial [Candidatus Saccharimonadales bacterium]
HDVHDVMNLYHEQGHEPPDYIKREVERCDDRYRQILTQLHTDGGAFEKVRAEMAGDKANRYDHTRLLTKSLRQDQDPQLNLSQPPAKE